MSSLRQKHVDSDFQWCLSRMMLPPAVRHDIIATADSEPQHLPRACVRELGWESLRLTAPNMPGRPRSSSIGMTELKCCNAT